ncbi:hypothetical protein EST38_g2215 [Candolleomyces aberdarensis]|uniref:Shugoshin C-terminal domain-containing protein n=1 Tax=Candolleomyces aberdarensis TaxID=2316362 RepID=A0A4Q2DV99_9AGAR|nr:hypothetical protein EST38_g2215 [Candolleomyces aberdarensis]
MSRRESRASLGAKQTDALYEFEAFKKKFLLANKHITKLNSTLSVRIEELNAQIHALNVENLRLRTAEIQLASELKREKEKSRKIMADAEAATMTLTRHLNHLRISLDIPRNPSTPPTPPSPKARRRPPPPDPTVEPMSPQGMRVARPPNVPGIFEEEEPCATSDEAGDHMKPPTPPKRKSKSKPRPSGSNLPLPTARSSTPTEPLPRQPSDVVHVDLSVAVASSNVHKRKTIRRQSGLLMVNPQATPRPASPAFGSPVRLQAGRAELQDEIAAANGEIDVDEEDPILERRNSRRKEKAKEQVPVVSTPMPAPALPPKDRKRRREDDDSHIVTVEAITTKLQDVTNGRAALQPIDNTVHDQYDDLVAQGKQLLAAPRQDSLTPSPVISATSEPDSAADTGGRERRARKGVNYAEPKLNTKMRRPDSEPKKKRSSAAAVMTMATASRHRDDPVNHDLDPHSGAEQQQGSSRLRSEVEPPSQSSSRRRSASPQPSGPPSMPDTPAVSMLPKKKSRPQMYHIDDDDEDESDGGDADEEWAPQGSRKVWSNVNVEGRKKTSSSSRRGAGKGDAEARRHSMAV